MPTTFNAVKERSIQECLRCLKSVREDLAVMPAFKQGSEWHTDRVKEEAYLVRSLARYGVSN